MENHLNHSISIEGNSIFPLISANFHIYKRQDRKPFKPQQVKSSNINRIYCTIVLLNIIVQAMGNFHLTYFY